MSLQINSPAYYTRIYGIDEDIYKMCLSVSKSIDVSKYTSDLDSIGITPIIAPKNVLDDGKCKEMKVISLTYRYADISLQIDYEKYISSDISIKKILIKENIFKSLLLIKKKLKSSFDYERLEKDIFAILDCM